MAEQKIEVISQSMIRDEGDASGGQSATVTVGAGIYVATSGSLCEEAAQAKRLLGPGISVSITVEGTQIRKISITRTM